MSKATRALQYDPDNFDAYADRGMALFELDQIDRALENLNNAIRLAGPSCPAFAYSYRAKIYYQRRQWSPAIRDASQAIKMEPKFAYHYRDRAQIYWGMNHLDEAIKDLSVAIRLDPGDIENYKERAHCFDSERQYKKALADFNQALKIKPKEPMYYGLRAEIYEKLGMHDKAAQDQKRANVGYKQWMTDETSSRPLGK